jgi:hypothetical protein
MHCNHCGELTHENLPHVEFDICDWDTYIACEECIPIVKNMLQLSNPLPNRCIMEHHLTKNQTIFQDIWKLIHFFDSKVKRQTMTQYKFGVISNDGRLSIIDSKDSPFKAVEPVDGISDVLERHEDVVSDIAWKPTLLELYQFLHHSSHITKDFEKIQWDAGPSFIKLQQDRIDAKQERLNTKRKKLHDMDRVPRIFDSDSDSS